MRALVGPRTAPLLAFVALGVFWGSWGAVLPAVADTLALGDSELGTALLCVAVGALPAMLFAGLLADHAGVARALPLGIALFGVAAFLPGMASGPVSLGAVLLLVGAASGGLDVVMNAAASAVETTHKVRLMHVAHAAFSASVVASALLSGLARNAGLSHTAVLTAVAVVVLAIALVVHVTLPPVKAGDAQAQRPSGFAIPSRLVIGFGLLCALVYLIEHGIQNWSAIHLERSFGAGPSVASLGPGLFAAAAVAGRLLAQVVVARIGDRTLLVLSGLLVACGAGTFAIATDWRIGLGGVVLAGAAIAVAPPSLLSLAGRHAPPDRRGTAVAAAAMIGYLGFLTSPPLVGFVSASVGLSRAFLALAGLSLLFALLAGVTVARARTAPARTETEPA